MDDLVLISDKDELNENLIEKHRPDYIFFPHWSWRVPLRILSLVETVAFHVAPLPGGRGGSPIQNLILGGAKSAPMNSLRMVEEVDAGPIYLSDELDLSGTLDEIFERATKLIWRQLTLIREHKIEPKPQMGKPYYFSRLRPSQNRITGDESFEEIWDRLRMVEADGYPNVFIGLTKSTLFLSGVSRADGEITGSFRIIPSDDGPVLE